MNDLMAFIRNKYIYVPFFLWFGIQLFKLIYDLVTTKKFNFKRIMGAGGMPSSHSAVVAGLATLIGKYEGVDSAIFALAFIVAFVVMYDACRSKTCSRKTSCIIKQIDRNTGVNRCSSLWKISRSSRSYTCTSICWSINRCNSWINSIVKTCSY